MNKSNQAKAEKNVENKEEVKKAENAPTIETGNYIIEIISDDQVIKKLAVANAAINITRLAEGGMTVDLK